jgi:hypothetical protein
VASGEREDEASPCSRLLDSVLMTLFRFISGRTRERDHQARRSTGRGHHRSRQPPPALTVSSLRLRNRTSGSNEVVHGIPFVPYVNEFAMYCRNLCERTFHHGSGNSICKQMDRYGGSEMREIVLAR